MNLLAAFQFLTVLPIRSSAPDSGRAAVWFPLVGALLGLLAAAACTALPTQGPLLALMLLALVTGGLHEDGLADVCDALRAYRPREKMFAILHDSSIGAHGATALVFSILLRWQALAHMQGNLWLKLPVAFALSRAAMVLVAATLPAAGAGLGRHFRDTLPRYAVALVTFQAVALAALLNWPLAGFVLVSQAVALTIIARWFYLRLGGCTGDCLGFAGQISEAVSLVTMAAL